MPVLGYLPEKGGFRLRYGRSETPDLVTMGVHPATMALLGFFAVGTQLKIEYPEKVIIKSCSSRLHIKRPYCVPKNGRCCKR